MQDSRLGEPASDELHVDWQPFLAGAKPHRQAGQAGNVERHGRALEVSGIHLLTVDHELRNAMLVGRDRQHSIASNRWVINCSTRALLWPAESGVLLLWVKIPSN